MRHLISDTATLMFLQRGFDEVSISEIAAACDVSEKTIYNYFPTKESLMLRSRRVISPRPFAGHSGRNAEHVSPVDAVVEILTDEMDRFVSYLDDDQRQWPQRISRFNDLIEGTPSLRAARADMIEPSRTGRGGIPRRPGRRRSERPRTPDRGRRAARALAHLLPSHP